MIPFCRGKKRQTRRSQCGSVPEPTQKFGVDGARMKVPSDFTNFTNSLASHFLLRPLRARSSLFRLSYPIQQSCTHKSALHFIATLRDFLGGLVGSPQPIRRRNTLLSLVHSFVTCACFSIVLQNRDVSRLNTFLLMILT